MTKNEAMGILGLLPGYSDDDLKKSYRKLASKFHPDKLVEAEKAEGEKQFKRAKEAFEFLESGGQDQPTDNGFKAWGTNSGFKANDMEEMLRKFNFFHARAQSNRSHPGDDWVEPNEPRIVAAHIDITLEEAYKGCVKTATIGNLAGMPVRCEIKQGISEDECIKIVEGNLVKYHIFARITDPYFTVDWGKTDLHRKGDLTATTMISPFRLILGGWEDVKMIDGDTVSVRIPPGLESGKILKVKGRGYWKNSGGGTERGDCYLRVTPDIKKLGDYAHKDIVEFSNAIEAIYNPPDGQPSA